jgi:hypothetical protein
MRARRVCVLVVAHRLEAYATLTGRSNKSALYRPTGDEFDRRISLRLTATRDD